MGPTFTFPNTVLSLDQIDAHRFPAGITQYEQTVLERIYQWLRGEVTFDISTSGTTGQQALKKLTRHQMQSSARATGSFLGLETGDQALIALDIRYIAGLMMLVRCLELELDARIVFPAANPLEALPAGERYAFSALVPYQLKTILEQTPGKLKVFEHAKGVLLGGAPVSGDLEAQLQHINCPFFATFGMTETATHFALKKLNGTDKEEAFHCLPGVEIATDEEGKLHIKGPMTEDRWLETNDMVALHGTNRFSWLGRSDHMINSGGVKVYPEQVEKQIAPVLTEKGITSDYFVGSLPHEQLGEEVVLFMEGPLPEGIKEENLLNAVKNKLPRYHTPRKVISNQPFRRTETGKIKRKATIEAAAKKLQTGYTS